MILQKEYHRTAKWNSEKNSWEILDKPSYRWCHIDDTPESDWFGELEYALNWIIEYEKRK